MIICRPSSCCNEECVSEPGDGAVALCPCMVQTNQQVTEFSWVCPCWWCVCVCLQWKIITSSLESPVTTCNHGFSWFQVGFHGFSWFKVDFPGCRRVFMVFHDFRLVIHSFRWVFMVFHDSRLIFHGCRWVFMVFHDFRLVIHIPDICYFFYTGKIFKK